MENLFKFDDPTFEVEIEAQGKPAFARLRKATLDEEIEREKNSSLEYREFSDTEEEIVVLEEKANAVLFNKTALEVKGFRISGEPKELVKDWRNAEPLLLSMPSSYKSAFIRGTRVCSAKFVEDDEDGIVLGGSALLPVDLIIGYEEEPDYTIRFELPEPTETERIAFGDKAMQFVTSKTRKKSAKVVTDRKTCVEFFDKLIKRGGTVVGGTVQDKQYAEFQETGKLLFLDAILPIYKAKVVNAAMTKYSAKLSD
jgi:hypothetical protein